MSKTFKRQRKEDKPRTKYKRTNSSRNLNKIRHTTTSNESEWEFDRYTDASDC